MSVPTSTTSAHTHSIHRLLRRAVDIRPDEVRATLLVYKDSQCVKQLIGMGVMCQSEEEVQPEAITADDVEWTLRELGAVPSLLEENPRDNVGNRKSKTVSLGFTSDDMRAKGRRAYDEEDADSVESVGDDFFD